MDRYRFSDVPRHQRCSYFFAYYSWHLAAVAFAVVVVGYLFYLAVLAPRTDVSLLWVSNSYSLEADGVVNERFRQLDWDSNGDGKSVVTIQHAEFGESFEATSADAQIALMTVLSAGETDILLVSQAALDWGMAMEIYGTYADLGLKGAPDPHEVVALDCAGLSFFAGTGIDAYETMYLVIAQPRQEPQAQERYEKNMAHLRSLLEGEI